MLYFFDKYIQNYRIHKLFTLFYHVFLHLHYIFPTRAFPLHTFVTSDILPRCWHMPLYYNSQPSAYFLADYKHKPFHIPNKISAIRLFHYIPFQQVFPYTLLLTNFQPVSFICMMIPHKILLFSRKCHTLIGNTHNILIFA